MLRILGPRITSGSRYYNTTDSLGISLAEMEVIIIMKLILYKPSDHVPAATLYTLVSDDVPPAKMTSAPLDVWTSPHVPLAK